MIAVAAFKVGFSLGALLLLALVVASLLRPSTRKAALVALGLLVAGVMFMRVSTVHYTEPQVALVSEVGDDQPATVDERPMDVEQASMPVVQPSMRQAAESLVVRAVPQGFQPEQVRLFAPSSVPEPMRQAVLAALSDRFPNASVTLVMTSSRPDASADRELDLSLQVISSYTRGFTDHMTRGARYRLTAITTAGSTSGEAEYQENEWRRNPAAVPAPYVRVHRKPGVAVIGTLALILLLYLGLNAWTRGYFQTRLRFLAAALFLLGIVLVMLLA